MDESATAEGSAAPAAPVRFASEKARLWELFIASSSALFLELALIRWIPGSVRVAGYFTNMILIASFLGLGLGAILSRRGRDLFRWWPGILVALSTVTLVFGAAGAANPGDESEFIWAGGPWMAEERIGWLWSLNLFVWEQLGQQLQGTSFYLTITLLFVLTAAQFTVIGHRIGLLFGVLPPLRAYGYDLAGSLVGVLGFTAASSLGTPPLFWFAVAVTGLCVITRWSPRMLLCGGGAIAATLLLVAISGHPYQWSPYYKIEIAAVDENDVKGAPPRPDPRPLGYRIRVNNDYHQTTLNLGPDAVDHPFVLNWRARYDAPHVGRSPGRVLVLGAGSGNDVAAALRHGATAVTAVEIDPILARTGRERHPERPYQDPRVTLVVDDARSFLKSTDQRFDTIVMGFLDSHTLMSSFSTLRIDNYVYTVESFREAFSLLDEGGRMALSFAAVRPFLASRLHRMLEAVSGLQMPVATGADKSRGADPCAGKAACAEQVPPYGWLFWATRPPGWQPPPLDDLRAAADTDGRWMPTDNWPFLYLQKPAIPTHYLYFMLLVIGLGFLSFRMVTRGERGVNLEFLLLGAGFLLLETRSVTEIALLFGSTWAVNAIAFGFILLAVLAANWVVMRWQDPPVRLMYGLVIVMLLVGWALPPGALYTESYALRLLLTALVLYSPIFFAGIVFSTRFRGAAHANTLFGSNLLGAMLGGALEYTSLLGGFWPLYLVGAALYAAAFLAGRGARAS